MSGMCLEYEYVFFFVLFVGCSGYGGRERELVWRADRTDGRERRRRRERRDDMGSDESMRNEPMGTEPAGKKKKA